MSAQYTDEIARSRPPMTFLPHGVVTQADPLLIVSVPEPAAWALMMLGFGGMGAALRRRRPQTA